MKLSTIVTYSAPNGETIDLTTAQCRKLSAKSKWPRNSRGEEFCQVQRGQHLGAPSFSDADLAKEVGVDSL